MFRITYGRHNNIHQGSYHSLAGIILAARENGGLVEEWDEQWKVWREV